MRALSQAVLLALLLWTSTARAEVQLEVRTDRTSLGVGDALVLRITVQTQGMSSPDITLPDFDGFQIVGQQVQRPMQFSFNFGARANVQSSTIYTFQLQPTRVGNLVIAPVRVELDGKVKTSEPLRISVSAGGGQPQASPPPPGDSASGASGPQGNASEGIENTQVDPVAFVRTVVDRLDPWEGQQVTVSMYLYVRERMQSGPAIRTEPTTDGLWTHDLFSPARPPQPSRSVVDGSVFAVYPLRRFAAFPLHAGEITIGPLALDIDTSSPFDIFNPSRANKQLHREGLPTVLKVKPLPEQGRPAGEIAVGRFEVEAKLDRAQAMTGDAVTLIATVRGQGNVRTAQLVLPAIPGLEALAPEVKDLVEASADGRVGGSREYRFLLVARAPGHYTLPPLSLATFDPDRGEYALKQSAALTLDVVGNTQAPAAAAGTGAAATAPTDDEAAAQADDTGPAPVWAPIRTTSALARKHGALHESALYPFALALPPLALLGAFVLAALRRRAATRAATREGRALREAEQHLAAAERAASGGDAIAYHAAASAALLTVLEARAGEKLTGLTHGQLDAPHNELGLDVDPRRRLREALEQSDLARFGATGAGSEALGAELDALRVLYRSLEGFEPRKAAA